MTYVSLEKKYATHLVFRELWDVINSSIGLYLWIEVVDDSPEREKNVMSYVKVIKDQYKYFNPRSILAEKTLSEQL